MVRVLILSSWVAHGHVGLSAAGPALQALGHATTQLPTTLLSNHPGWPHVAAHPMPPDEIGAMLDALEANGWLSGLDACLVGYLPTAGHVDLAAETIGRLRRAARPPRVVVDPILGDLPKGLYIPHAAAAAIRDRLVPLADVLTPNRFELGWLTGADAATMAEAQAAASAMVARTGAEVFVTSPPFGPAETGILALTGTGIRALRTPLRADVPHGVGDVFSALIAAGLPVERALGHLDALIVASLGAPHLKIAEAAPVWTTAPPCPFPPQAET
ncbi:pyridoxine kinase [Rhodovulum iodosum]|uniref:pyridoxal kinase n=1 Tax=Rhodovulum iodosum TaxID=68291 RepID=A0ABV3XXH3_9RHOB|nr:PfkB family carbohydrate kinase [Rhodovulum robiginosum]